MKIEDCSRRQFLETAAFAAAGVSAAHAQTEAEGRKTMAHIGPYQGVPTLFVNGFPLHPYIYYLPVPVKEHIADFAQAGIHIFTWGQSSIIPNSMAMGWEGPGKYDYTRFDSEVRVFLEADPECFLFPRLAVSAPQWWLEAHPEDRIHYDEEPQRGGQTQSRRRHETSLASRLWLREATEAMVRLIGHVRKQPYRDHFIGFQVTGGRNEWTYSGGFGDFSASATARWREWLRAKYAGDAGALREAWKNKDSAFESAVVPPRAERLRTDAGLLRDPEVSRWVSDYYEFYSDVTAEALIRFCGAGKEATNGESLMGAFYGYLMCENNGYDSGLAPVHWGHQAMRKVLASPHVDFLCSPYQYTHRGPGGADAEQSLPDSVKLHGKLFISECDQETFIQVLPRRWTQGRPLPTVPETFAFLKRDFSHRFLKRYGFWWMDLWDKAGWYHHPDIVRFLRRTRLLMDKSRRLDMRYQGEAAVFIDEETPFYVKPGVELLYPLVFLQDLCGLARMGTTYDVYLHNDLTHPNFPEYKMYVFLSTLYLTEAERLAIQSRVQCDNKLAVWMYAPGILSEKGLSPANMKELTGISLRHQAVRWPSSFGHSRVFLTDYDHPLTRGVNFTYFGTESPISPAVYCDEPDLTVLGRLMPTHGMENFGEFNAFTVKKFADWTSVFIGVPNAPPELLRNAARMAGCHIYSDENQVVYANSHFLSIHTNRGGRRRLVLPRRSDVYDAFTEQLMARGVTEFTDELPRNGGRVYYLGDIADIADPASRFEL